MEYLEGWDLSALIQRTGSLPVDQTVEFVLQTCEALAEAHGLGIVHRDLKPSNLFCIRGSDNRLSIKVLDFGISKTTISGASGPDLGLTKARTVMGSPHYMSPEQMRSARDVDARADIWALGIILYELLTGTVPFTGQDLPELCVKIVSDPAPRLESLRPDAPDGIESVILKCLEKDRNDRYSNVAELAAALAPFGAPLITQALIEHIFRVIQAASPSAGGPVSLSLGGPALLPTLPPSRMPPVVVTTPPWTRTPSSSARKTPKMVAVLASAAAAATATAGLFLFVGRAQAPESGQPLVTGVLVAAAAAPAPPFAFTSARIALPAPVADDPAPKDPSTASAVEQSPVPAAAETEKSSPATSRTGQPASTPRSRRTMPPSALAPPANAPPHGPRRPASDWGGRL
jgi:serine/threonine-protein kinase